MKNSGIAWVGEIPKNWKIVSVSAFFDEVKRPNTNQEETNTLQFKMGDIISKKGGDSKYNPETIEAYNVVEPGTIMLNGLNLSFDLISQRVAQVREKGAITSTYLAIMPKKGLCSDYAKYLLKSYDNCKALHSMGRGLRATISFNSIRNEPILLPLESEQQSIANFLDEKCSEIDELISLQEKMIDELKSYKQSVITEAVTKGLDRNVKMKDSGIAMIGTIPYHWGIAHFTKVNWIRARLGWKGLKAEEYVEQGHPFLSAFNIINDKLDWRDLNFIDDIRYEESPEIKLTVNDLVLVKDGAGIGKCAVVDSLPYGTSTVNSSLAVITPNKHINSLYQYYCLKSEAFQKIIWQLKIGMGVPHLTQENMKAIINPCPPLEEQIKIASYLDTKCSEIDTLISIKQQKIEELKEYKKSLIYEYVTGKKEVV